MGDNGELSRFAPPPRQKISRTGWRVGRATRSDVGTSPRVIATLEDTPFYARSLIATRLFGAQVSAVHESLSLDRLVRPVVRLMLPFRMPRWRYRG
jgi:carotenoid 1,2-hydratase